MVKLLKQSDGKLVHPFAKVAINPPRLIHLVRSQFLRDTQNRVVFKMQASSKPLSSNWVIFDFALKRVTISVMDFRKSHCCALHHKSDDQL